MNAALVLADAKVIGSGFIDSLAQFAVSPWALIPLGVALLMGAASWYLGRRSRITHLVFLPPEDEPPDLLGCPTGCGDPGCAGDCTWVTADALAELRRRLNEGDRRG